MALIKNQRKKLKREIFKWVGCNEGQLSEEDIFEKLNEQHTVSLADVKDICWELCEAQELTQRLNKTKSVYYLTVGQK
jgi:hypothetical protein